METLISPSRRRQRRRRLIVGAIALAGLTVLLLPNWLRLRALKTRTRAVDADIARLAAMITQLNAEQQKLQSDPTYIERVARQEFRATRPGEILLKMDDAADGPVNENNQ